MNTAAVKAAARKPKWTTVQNAGRRIGKSPYQVLRLISVGELEADLIDTKAVVRIDSLERYEKAALSA
jgi:hypothetical protein